MGVGFCPEFGCRALPALSVWQDSGFAADRTNAMLAVVRADDEALVPPQAAGLALSAAPPQCSPCVGETALGGYTTTPAPNRAHSGSHGETGRVFRVDGDDVSGSGIIDTIDPLQADQPVAVALAEGHRDAVSP